MVRGVEIFRDYFRDYTGQYVFIGGTACDIILGTLGCSGKLKVDTSLNL